MYFPPLPQEEMYLKQHPEIVSDTLQVLTVVSAPETGFSFFTLIGYHIVIMHLFPEFSICRGKKCRRKALIWKQVLNNGHQHNTLKF